MHQRPESLSSTLAVNPASPPGSPLESQPDIPPPPQTAETHIHQVPRWLERVELFLRVMLRMYIGLFVFSAPWWHTFWDQNPLFLQFPSLGKFALHGAVRGVVSGLGLLNLWIAFQDAIRHRDGDV